MSFRTSGGGSAVGRGGNLVVFVFRRYLFKGQTFAAHGRGGLVTFAAPKVTKRRAHVIADGSLPHKACPANQTKPGLGNIAPLIAPAVPGVCKFPYALATHNPPSFCPISPEPAPMTHTGPTLFYLIV